MKISFLPQRSDNRLQASVAGDVLTVNGEAYDFSALPDGATLPRAAVACAWLASDVERIDGRIHLTLVLPHAVNAPQETRFPDPVTVAAGPVPLPPYEIEQEAEA